MTHGADKAQALLNAPILLIRAIREFHAWIRGSTPSNRHDPLHREDGTRGVCSATLLSANYERIQSSKHFLIGM